MADPSGFHTHRCRYLRPATSQPSALCSPFCKQFYVPTSVVTSYKTRRLTWPNRSGLVFISKTLTDFHTIWYRLVLTNISQRVSFSLNSDSNEDPVPNPITALQTSCTEPRHCTPDILYRTPPLDSRSSQVISFLLIFLLEFFMHAFCFPCVLQSLLIANRFTWPIP